MKILLLSIGKEHDDYVNAGIVAFTRRLNNYVKAGWILVTPPKLPGESPPDLLKRKEAELILSKIEKDDYLVLLDERGKMMTSVQLASFIQTRANSAVKKVVFLVGGAFGVDQTVFDRADFTWSLSPLVFPHQLVRLILCEQLYRACTIIKNEKYHHV